MARRQSAFKHTVMYVFTVFCAVLLVLLVALNAKTNNDTTKLLRESHELLHESIKSQLLAICRAALGHLDPAAVATWNPDDAMHDDPDYAATLARLRSLAENTETEYIYVLKRIDGHYMFVLDTDPEDQTFPEYELSPVHEKAFQGVDSAGIMNVVDIYGSFHTGAIPIEKDGEVIAIVSADIRDTLIRKRDELVRREMETTRRNTLLMAVTVALVLLGAGTILFRLMRQVRIMQDRLTQMAHYDPVTGLPNRQYLIDHLEALLASGNKAPFALFFTDLDNFKLVNDKAGHDAGDALLKRIGAFLNETTQCVYRKQAQIFHRDSDRADLTARIGGDEFVLLVPGVENREEAGGIAQTIIEIFHQRVTDKHVQKYSVSLSIGAALYPSQSEDYHIILKYADIAMYHAKRAGKNDYRVYEHEMPEKREA